MAKIGVGIGEEFPVGDPSEPRPAPGEGETRATSAKTDQSGDTAHAEFERRKWQREGQRAWDEDVRNQRAEWQSRDRTEWEAKKRAFKEKIHAAVLNGIGNPDNWQRMPWGYSWRPRTIGAWGIAIALLVLAIPILAIIVIVALIAAAISAPLIVLGVLAALIFIPIAGHRYRHGHTAGRYRYYTDDDIQSPPRSSRTPSWRARGPIVTPPPQEHS
jgi:hypothetical protein